MTDHAKPIQQKLEGLTETGGRVMLSCQRYDLPRPLVIDTPSLCLCGEVWSYSADPNGVFEAPFGTKLRLVGQGHPAIRIGQTRTLGGVIVRDLGIAGDLVGMDTRSLFGRHNPACSAGLCFDAVRTDQCEFSKLSFVGLSGAVCAVGDAEIDACLFERLNMDGCANGVWFAPRAAYYPQFRGCIAADNPYYGFYADGRFASLHNLEVKDTHFVRNGGAFADDAEYPAAVLFLGINRSAIDHCLVDYPGTFWYYDADATENKQRQPTRRAAVGIWVIGRENRITDNTITHSTDDAIRVEGAGNLLISNIADGNIRIRGEGNTVVNAVFTRPEARLILEGGAAASTVVIGVPDHRIVFA